MTSFEVVVNAAVTFVISGPPSTPLTDAVLYINGTASGITPTIVQIGSTNAWRITFTPTATGIYSFYAFGSIQLQAQSVAKSTSGVLANIEDEALGSWTWDKETGVLTVLRQNGTTMATHNVVDTLTTASRERVS
jgi:hypothetical protein